MVEAIIPRISGESLRRMTSKISPRRSDQLRPSALAMLIVLMLIVVVAGGD